jgi:hypothetical protein
MWRIVEKGMKHGRRRLMDRWESTSTLRNGINR